MSESSPTCCSRRRWACVVSAPGAGGPPSRGYRIDDNVIARMRRGSCCEGTTGSRLRGNVLRRGGRRDRGGRRRPWDRGDGQRLPPHQRLVHRRAGPGGGRQLLGDGRRLRRGREGAGADQRASVEAGERGGLLAKHLRRHGVEVPQVEGLPQRGARSRAPRGRPTRPSRDAHDQPVAALGTVGRQRADEEARRRDRGQRRRPRSGRRTAPAAS